MLVNLFGETFRSCLRTQGHPLIIRQGKGSGLKSLLQFGGLEDMKKDAATTDLWYSIFGCVQLGKDSRECPPGNLRDPMFNT
jgi:hypothetical protein